MRLSACASIDEERARDFREAGWRPIHELRTDKARDQFARQRRLDLRRETLHCCTARAGTALAAIVVADIADVTAFSQRRRVVLMKRIPSIADLDKSGFLHRILRQLVSLGSFRVCSCESRTFREPAGKMPYQVFAVGLLFQSVTLDRDFQTILLRMVFVTK
jgi:hypothetical protein